ncbi:MAG TPA: hypothetical protein VFL03_16410 [Candidatus Limnocylindrales bacterium]|nr:hypothetical protein [Candidatus Limnocylindrales bacterium]
MRRALTRPPRVAGVLAVMLAIGVAVIPPAAAPLAPTALRPMLAALDAPAVLAAGDLGVTTATRYVVVPSKGVVRVIVDVTATNEKPDTTVGGATTRYYYDGVNLGIQPEARNVRATQDDAPIRVDVSNRDGYRLVSTFFRSALFFGQQATVRLRFDLPAGKPRSNSDVRVGSAFASFLAWSFGDRGTVRIDIPKAFTVDVSGSEMSKSTKDDGTQVFRAETTSPVSWFAWVNARNDDGLTREQVELGNGEMILVRGWPEDSRWRKRVRSILSDGIPELTRRIGLPWPVDGSLSVLEIHTPLLEGYAGFYDPATDEITISEELDDTTIVHEASHAWFNQRLFTERWITEGLAETYASEVVDAIGGDGESPRPVDPESSSAFPLNDWPGPAPIKDDAANAREQFGYDAAHSVIAQIVDAAGLEGMQRVFAGASAGTTAYAGEATPEKSRLPANDWRRFLDLVEEQGGATGAEALLRTWALTDDEAALLPARDKARDAYEGLAADADGWAAPVGVRLAMDGWQFDDAQTAIDAAHAVLARRDSIEALAATEGLDTPDGLEAAYEAAPDAVAIRDVGSAAAKAEAALRTIAAAGVTVEAPRDWLTELGLSGKTPDADLDQARAAWESARYDDAASLASFAAATIAVAPDAGRGRALVIGGIVGLVVILLIVTLVAWRRSHRSRSVVGAATAAGEGAPTGRWTPPPTTTAAPYDDETVAWTPARDDPPPRDDPPLA